MRREIIWTAAAEVDAQQAFAGLEDATEGGGMNLVKITDQLLSLLEVHPFLAPVWRSPVRRAILRRTHFGLFYTVEPARIVIIGLQDLRQHPAWLRREILLRLP